ncbi:MAG TPA: ATP-binding protein [Tepidisphaeraceae bacterium]|nr:ATP-binding protein [Tepidisphaeraceae bacterium]
MAMVALCAAAVPSAFAADPAHDHAMAVNDAASSGDGFFTNLLKTYTPRQICMHRERAVVWLHFASDAFIAIAYFTIPVALMTFVRRRKDLAFNWMFVCFAVFILACGLTHVMNVLALWQAVYRLDGLVKLVTAVASISTAILLWRLLPAAIALPSPGQLREANAKLGDEIIERRQAEESLRQMQAQLEQRVRERTAELETANSVLRSEVTARQAAEAGREQLLRSERAAREEAERASRMKDDFLATLSHELRTPLNAILGWSQLLLRELVPAPARAAGAAANGTGGAAGDAATGDGDGSTRSPDTGGGASGGAAAQNDDDLGLRTIERNARAQAQLIDDLLDMSRIQSGKLRLDVQRADVVGVVSAAIETVAPAAEAKEIRLTRALDPVAGPVSGDPARLQQVVWNLLTNAVKFTPKGGQVHVDLRRVDSSLQITVSDSGIGIHADFLPHVFDRFRQADSATTRQHGGLGLGLSIARSLVEMHGGTITASSPGEGHGATFAVHLPLLAVSAPRSDAPAEGGARPSGWAEPAHAALEAIDLTGVKVLVVDDEEDARTLVARVLQQCGAEVIRATSAAEALEAVRAHRPNVILSDIGMPAEDGYSLIRKVRELGADSGGATPAAALTAFARSEDRRRALMAGFQSHIVKPVEPAELATVVASLAGRTG